MMENMDRKNYSNKLKKLKEAAPEPYKAFRNFHRMVFFPGALSKREKEIIAAAVAHATKCRDCTDVHTKKAKALGASQEELVEAAFVAAVVEAGAIVNRCEEQGKAFHAYTDFLHASLNEGQLNGGLKALIAVAVACAIQDISGIERYTKHALEKGATNEQIGEAMMVASALKAGKVYAQLMKWI